MYKIFKIGAFLAIKIYCRKTVVNFDGNLTFDKPKIIACNHPNSFFDAIAIAVHYPKPIYFLARGDAFKKPLVSKILNALHLIPIYRLSEGKNNLSKNDATFKKCIELLKQNQTILIFSEGICVQEWNLRPLKKGTARLSLMAIQEGIINLKIQPTNINYSSFNNNPKDVLLNFNAEFEPPNNLNIKEAEFYLTFNKQLKNGIIDKMIVSNATNEVKLFNENKKNYLKIALAFPALIGFILNYWIYRILKNFTLKKTKNTVFYDSILFGFLLLVYPIMVLLISICVGLVFNFKVALLVFIIFPISAWCYKKFKS